MVSTPSTWGPAPDTSGGASVNLPQSGTVTSAAVTPTGGSSATFGGGAATIGPFQPGIGAAIKIYLTGDAAFSAQIMSSIDGGTTKTPITTGGGAVCGTYVANSAEIALHGERVTIPNELFYLVATVTNGGTLKYWLGQ